MLILCTACLNLHHNLVFCFVEGDETYSNDSLWLSTILNHLQTGTPISLIITNANSHLGGFQPLKTVAVTPTPLVDVLGKSEYDLWGFGFLKRMAVSFITSPHVFLTLPRSMMKQSPRLKLAQDIFTSVARMARRPLMWSRRFTFMSLVTTCWNPEATPPCCVGGKVQNIPKCLVALELQLK